MKIKKGFVMREVAGQSVIIAVGAAAKSYNGMIKLNDTAKIAWKCLENGCEIDDMVNAIIDEYDVDKETVKKDMEKFIEALEGANILE